MEKRVCIRSVSDRRWHFDATLVMDANGAVLDVKDFAMSRRMVIDRLCSLGAVWCEHMNKIGRADSRLLADNLDHWLMECVTWWNDAALIKMKHSNQYVSMELVHDLFLDGHVVVVHNYAELCRKLVARGNVALTVGTLKELIFSTIRRGV